MVQSIGPENIPQTALKAERECREANPQMRDADPAGSQHGTEY